MKTTPLLGHCVVFTGDTIIVSRSEVRTIVERAGGTAMGVVTDQTTMLVVGGPENVSKRKIDLAKRCGARLLTEAEFFALLGGG